jgi:hypothetical protein
VPEIVAATGSLRSTLLFTYGLAIRRHLLAAPQGMVRDSPMSACGVNSPSIPRRFTVIFDPLRIFEQHRHLSDRRRRFFSPFERCEPIVDREN